MKYTILSPETEQKIATVEALEDGYGITLAGQKEPLKIEGCAFAQADRLEIYSSSGARSVFPAAQTADGTIVISTHLGTVRLGVLRGALNEGASGGRAQYRSVKSSMPGKVLKVLCKPGDKIEAGQPMLIIEAMKMENEIKAPHAGFVEEVPVQPGQKVETGEVLVKLGTAQG